MFTCYNAYCTHNRAGEITYVQTGPLTLRATITTYTKASSTAADRDTLLLMWGDGNSSFVPRTNGNGEEIPGEDIKINYYTAEHTYPGRATYTLSFNDPNRVNNIQNVNFPNSVDVQFYVETVVTFVNTQVLGLNNSVQLLQAPIDYACVGERFIHNPNAFDADGDSLSFELIVPLETEGMEVPQYEFPNEIQPGLDNNISLDSRTGDFVWESPQSPGEYSIAIRVNEYRQGFLLTSVIRDMQIFVDICDNQPPEIETIDEICVIAGERIEIPITINDPNVNQQVRISATGGPFLLDFSPAILTGSGEFEDVPYTESFIWETHCEHILAEPYQIVIKAQDNGRSDGNGLSNLKTIRIKVVGPPPEDVQSESLSESAIEVSWEKPYLCEETVNDYFIGFSVWRKINSQQFAQDSCQEGLENSEYQKIVFITLENEDGRYFHIDNNVEKGKIYCYRILAEFGLRTINNDPYNIVPSLPSKEVCSQLKQDIPLITKVSVLETDATNGRIEIEWIKPLARDLDTLANPGPYDYKLMRSIDGNNYGEVTGAVGMFQTMDFNEPINLSFIDEALNTENTQYFYRVDFYSLNDLYSMSPIASSVFVGITSSDKINRLSWIENTPWQNYNYKIHRSISGAPYEFIGESTSQNYDDRFLTNDLEYCYFIESEGSYGLTTTPTPLFNLSQITCGTPIDTVGPCAPELMVTSPCDLIEDGQTVFDFVNQLNWNMPNLVCENSQDLASYNLYYTFNLNEPLDLIEQFNNETNNTTHAPSDGISGCYAVSAIDSLGNEGPLSEIICVESCPIYELPNTFTPNNDNANDIFVPRENKFVTSVDFKVFNRWGNLLFETVDPELNWNGQNQNGSDIDAGTYYYTCKVFDIDIDGSQVEVDFLKGNIQIFK